jgi:adenylate kinase
MKNIVIIGPPGSGKDTQIDELAKYLKFQLISGGDIVRKLAEKDTKLRKIMDEGELIDDAIVLAEVDKVLATVPSDEGVVFDGFPRTLHQAGSIGEILLHHGRTLDIVIYLSLDEDVIVSRLSRRKVCSLCGHNIHKGAEKCSECGGRPITRHDDEPAVIIKRVQTFLENTLPLINYYRNQGIIIEVNGNQSIAAVAADIKEKLVSELK